MQTAFLSWNGAGQINMKWYKNIWLYIAVILAIAAGYGWYVNDRQQLQHKQYIQQQDDTITYYKDKAGTIHAVMPVQQIPAHLYKHITDSIVQQVAKNTKARDLVQHTTVKTSTTGQGSAPIHDTIIITTTDTNTAQYFDFEDKALKLSGLLYNGQADINYTFALHLSHTTKWHRPGLFKKKQLIVDAYSLTPHTTITGLQTFVIQQPPKKFYETKAFSFALGIGIGFAIGSR